jgi:hypothetical protein
MAIDFPASPTLNDVFTVGNVTYVWDGTKWTASVTGGISLDKIEEGNTSAEVIDTGSDGRFVVTTEGTERLRVDPSGRLLVGTDTGSHPLSVVSSQSSKIQFGQASDQGGFLFSDGPGAFGIAGGGYYNGANWIAKNTASSHIRDDGDGNIKFAINTSLTAGSTFTPTERVRITSAGLVGIGTGSPSEPLDVVSASGTARAIRVRGRSADNIGLIDFYSSDNATRYATIGAGAANTFVVETANNERLRVDSSGRVGIGTSSPGYRLDVTSQLGCTHSGAIRHLVNIDSDGGKSYWYNGTPANTAYILGDTGGAYFAGNVGIGTTSPAKKLDVYEGSTGNVEQYLRNTTINLLSKIDGTTGAQFGTETSHPLVLLTANSERARIDNSGRLLVGTSTARAFNTHNGSLQIDGDNYSESTVAIIANSNDANGAYLTFAKQRSGSSGGNTVVQNNDMIGELRFNAGDGTDCDSLAGLITCRVDGTPGVDDMPGRLVFSTTADGASNPTERFYLYSDGNVRAPGVYALTTAVAADVRVDSEGYLYRSTSSIRYKKDVETLQDGYADTILNARPVWFRSLSEKDNPDWGYWGFIAEEVEQIDPRLCTYGEDEEGNQRVESVQYDRFVPHLLNLIKRQQQAIETLEGMVAVNNITIDEQQHQLSTLAARLTALETP